MTLETIKNLKPETIFVPNRKMQDMFEPDSIWIDTIFEDANNGLARFWFADILNESFGFEEVTFFLVVGENLYAFNFIENTIWYKKLDDMVDGYTLIPVGFNPAIHSITELISDRLEDLEYYDIEKSGVQNDIYIGKLLLMLIATLSSETINIVRVKSLWEFVKEKLQLTGNFEDE